VAERRTIVIRARTAPVEGAERREQPHDLDGYAAGPDDDHVAAVERDADLFLRPARGVRLLRQLAQQGQGEGDRVFRDGLRVGALRGRPEREGAARVARQQVGERVDARPGQLNPADAGVGVEDRLEFVGTRRGEPHDSAGLVGQVGDGAAAGLDRVGEELLVLGEDRDRPRRRPPVVIEYVCVACCRVDVSAHAERFLLVAMMPRSRALARPST
jgi:hypothetical protein